ncbi:WYL domain-containing protein [Brevundimonas sp. 2R-24]|uniref:WYL domain-containing protein n=1 Tax=Peiella sedimenti TaxID=3061083 RepID=A0ABT8SPY3_9CAUL|nr:WYL domain-containing protein [Caulobacteraceae bacterium XZ-24]
MRHDKAAMVLDLARRLAASAEGLTLDEMARAMEVGRRTAERMRDAVWALYPQMEEVPDPPTKRWRIRGGLSAFEQAPDTTELLELTKAAEALRRAGEPGRAAALEALEHKIKAAMRSTTLNRLAPDLEALVRAETIAVQAGPRPFEDEAVLSVIRRAIMAGTAVGFVYMGGSTPGRKRRIAPFGLMFGRANYLVGGDLDSAQPEAPRTFRLDHMEGVTALPDRASPPADFDLQAFASRSFGVYQGELEEVVLHIAPDKADEARAWRWHPTQTLTNLADGGVEVRFNSSGMRELAWHLFTWGEAVRIAGPDSLKAEMRQALEAAARAHGGA